MAKRISLFEKYMPGEDARQFAMTLASNFAPVIIRVRPQRVSSYDYAKEGMIQIGMVPDDTGEALNDGRVVENRSQL